MNIKEAGFGKFKKLLLFSRNKKFIFSSSSQSTASFGVCPNMRTGLSADDTFIIKGVLFQM